MGKFKGLEMCRGVAALLVVLYHCQVSFLPLLFGAATSRYSIPGFFQFGHAGVDFFFVLSGFIITYAHGGDGPGQLPIYGWKRFWRIYPSYWIVTLFMLTVYFSSSKFGTGTETGLDVIIKSLLLFPQEGVPVLGVAWTLQHEVLFYLLFAVGLINRRAGAAVMVLWMAGLIGWQLTGSGGFPADFLFSAYNLEFAMGMAAAILSSRARLPLPHLLVALGAGGFVATGIAEVYAGFDHVLGARLCYGLSSMVLVLGMIEWERRDTLAVPAAMVGLGAISYPLYLIHNPAMSVLARLLKAAHAGAVLPPLLGWVLLVSGAILVGWAFTALCDRPLHRLGARWSRSVLGLRPAAAIDFSGNRKNSR